MSRFAARTIVPAAITISPPAMPNTPGKNSAGVTTPTNRNRHPDRQQHHAQHDDATGTLRQFHSGLLRIVGNCAISLSTCSCNPPLLATIPRTNGSFLLYRKGSPSKSVAMPPASSTINTPAHTSHSLFGPRLKNTSPTCAATDASLYAVLPSGLNSQPERSESKSPREISLREAERMACDCGAGPAAVTACAACWCRAS